MECKNCNWKGKELTKESILKSGLMQMAGCCPNCGESIKNEGKVPEDVIAPKPVSKGN